MRNLSGMNDLCNFQDTCILCEIIEDRFEIMRNMYGFNPRGCNLAGTSSGCIERNLSSVIIALPVNKEDMEIFEKTLTGGFSGINTRLGFATQTIFLNLSQSDFNKLNIDHSFKCNKRKDLKTVYKIQLDNESQYLDELKLRCLSWMKTINTTI